MNVPGTKLGLYEIQSPLGAGGLGEVYGATDTNSAVAAASDYLSKPELFIAPVGAARVQSQHLPGGFPIVQL